MDSPSVKQTIEDRIELALEESNAALDNSGITSAELRFRIVHVYYEPSYVETSFSSTLSHLRNDGDGFMEIILSGNYVYGGGWEVIRFNQGSFEHVLFCGCDG